MDRRGWVYIDEWMGIRGWVELGGWVRVGYEGGGGWVWLRGLDIEVWVGYVPDGQSCHGRETLVWLDILVLCASVEF